MKKLGAYSKSQERNQDTHATCEAKSGKGCWSFILTKLLNSSNCSGIGGDANYLSDGVGALFNLSR